jgi:hypothetical protein
VAAIRCASQLGKLCRQDFGHVEQEPLKQLLVFNKGLQVRRQLSPV